MLNTILTKGVVAVLVAFIAVITFAIGLNIFGGWHDDWSGYNAQFQVSDGICNIAVVPVDGLLTTSISSLGEEDLALLPVAYADAITATLATAEVDRAVEGIVVRIDSPGGFPVASEIIADAVESLQKPVAAVIREYGTSGGYLVATAADTIFASPFSEVGGIGITSSYVQNVEQNRQEGLEYVSLSSAKFKDAGDPNRPLSTEERALFERNLSEWHEYFVTAVAENRGMQVAEVERLADGSTLAGTLALEAGLIDSLGSQEDTRGWFAQQIGIAPEEVIFCQ